MHDTATNTEKPISYNEDEFPLPPQHAPHSPLPEPGETKKSPSVLSRILPTAIIVLLAIPAYFVVSNLPYCINKVQSFFHKPAATSPLNPNSQTGSDSPGSDSQNQPNNGEFAQIYQGGNQNQNQQNPFPNPSANSNTANTTTEEDPQALTQPNPNRTPPAPTNAQNNSQNSPQAQASPSPSQLLPFSNAQNPTQATMASDSKDNYEETSVSMQNVDVALFPKASTLAPQILHLNVPIVHQKRLLSFKTDDLQKMRGLVVRIRESLAKQDSVQKELQQELKDYNELIQKGTPEAVLNADSPSLIRNTNAQPQ